VCFSGLGFWATYTSFVSESPGDLYGCVEKINIDFHDISIYLLTNGKLRMYCKNLIAVMCLIKVITFCVSSLYLVP